MEATATTEPANDTSRRSAWRTRAALPASASMRRLVSLGREFLLRLGACSAEATFVYAALLAYGQDHTRITLLLMAASGAFTVGALLFARAAIRMDWHPLAVATMPVIYAYPLFIDVHPGLQILPEWLATVIEFSALVWLLYAKVSIGRSFGLLPANRGVIVSGPYRWVRHPIYAGYFVFHLAFLLASFSWQNLMVFTTLYAAQIFRVLREEKLLSGYTDYQAYRSRVPYRILPGVL